MFCKIIGIKIKPINLLNTPKVIFSLNQPTGPIKSLICKFRLFSVVSCVCHHMQSAKNCKKRKKKPKKCHTDTKNLNKLQKMRKVQKFPKTAKREKKTLLYFYWSFATILNCMTQVLMNILVLTRSFWTNWPMYTQLNQTDTIKNPILAVSIANRI